MFLFFRFFATFALTMERMNAYLRDLLILHDCVILPDFGGFVGNYKPAQKTEQHYFTPPCKEIAFNSQLKANDGLFANSIVAIEKISYAQALSKLLLFVNQIQKELKAKGEYTIPSVGRLKKNSDQAILFVPDRASNLLISPVGLGSFSITPLPKQKTEPLEEETKTPIIVMPLLRKVLVAGVSGVALISLLLNQGKIENRTLASLSPIQSEVLITEAKVSVEKAPIEKKEEILVLQTPQAKEEIAPMKEEAKAPSVVKKYHIVVGCFSLKENAELQKNKLEQKGISATVFDYGKGLTGVLAGSFDSFQKAKPVMDSLRASGDAPSAWVLKRKLNL